MEDKKKIPELRFGGFKDDWEEKKFEKVFHFSTGKNIKQNQASPEFETPCIRYGELYHMYNEVVDNVINRTNLERTELKFSLGDEILLPSAGEDPLDIGSASALTIPNVAIGRTINILSPKSDSIYSQIFASYYINVKLRIKISLLAKGVSISNVYNSDLSSLKLNLPSLPEQQQIGSFFKNIDELITKHQKKHDRLITLKKSMLEKMFPTEGQTVPEIRFKGFEGEWVEQFVESLCSISTGNSNTQDNVEDGKYPFYVRSATIERSDKYLFDEEAVLTVGDGVGTGKVYHYVNGKYDLHQRVYRMFGFKEVTGTLFYYIFSQNFQKRVFAMTAKTSVDSVRLEMISKMKISYPAQINEQQKIGNYFQNLDTLISKHKKQLEKLSNFKQSLSEKMFV